MENLSKLKPAFDKDGTVTAGNASSVNDGAAAVVLMEERAAKDRGLKPIAKLIDYAVAGVEPGMMGIGPVSAVKKLYERTGLSNKDIDVFEANEAFAAQALAVQKELELPPEKTNPNGSGISLGHPFGSNWSDCHREGNPRIAPDRRKVRPCDDVYRRRPGYRCHLPIYELTKL